MKTALLLLAASLIACGGSTSESVQPAVAQLDQQNLLDGSLAGQGIGMYNDITGAPGGGDQQTAQTFTVGISGRLARVRVPLRNIDGANAGAVMELHGTVGGVPDDAQKLGEVTVPVSALVPTVANSNPETWVVFDFSSLAIDLVAGQQRSIVLRSPSTVGILYNTERTLLYPGGKGFRRNRQVTATWSNVDVTYGFQTFVIPR